MANKQLISNRQFSGFFNGISKLIVCGLLLNAHSMYAQDDDNLKGSLEIIKNAKIDLGTANRNFEKIVNVQPVQTAKPLEYQNQDVELVLPKLDTKIKVVTTKVDALPKLYSGYVKAGFGNYTTPYFEGFFNNKRSQNATYGFHIKHYSSNGPVTNSSSSENLAELYGKFFTKKSILRASGSYLRNRYNFYGYNHDLFTNVSADSIKQVFTTYNVNVGIENKDKTSTFNYDLGLSYFNFSDFYKAKESEYLANLSADYKLDDSKSIVGNAILSVAKRQDSTTLGRTLFMIKPALLYKLDKLKIRAGFNLAYSNDTIKEFKNLHIYPSVHVEYNIAGNKAILFGGLDGEMQKNTLRTFAKENPYLSSNVLLYHTNKTLEFYAGLKGTLSDAVNYKLNFSSSNYKNLYFFNNSATDSSRFSVLYDQGAVNVVNVGGELSYSMSSSFRLGVNANYYGYNMSRLENAWQRPSFTASLLGNYNLNQKLYFNVDIYYLSGLTGKNYISNKQVDLPGIFDANLKVDYLFSKVFSSFIEVNNILSNNYQRYLYYNNKGINILVGLTYAF